MNILGFVLLYVAVNAAANLFGFSAYLQTPVSAWKANQAANKAANLTQSAGA